MNLPQNRFKAAIADRRRQIGIWHTIPDPSVSEMLAGCGYDWMLIDTEHSPMRAEDTLPLMQAAAPYPVSCAVRVGWNDAVEIKRVLDLGAQTILVPYVQSAEEAEMAVAAAHYPPRGVRGVAGSTRASRWGGIEDYSLLAGKEICVLVQVETLEAMDNLEGIAGVDGVDGVFVGPADLAATMGHLGRIAHPDVMAAVHDAIGRIVAAGKPAGFLSANAEIARRALEAGATFVAVDVDAALLRRAAAGRRAEFD